MVAPVEFGGPTFVNKGSLATDSGEDINGLYPFASVSVSSVIPLESSMDVSDCSVVVEIPGPEVVIAGSRFSTFPFVVGGGCGISSERASE